VSLDNNGTESNHDREIEEAAVQPQRTSSQSLVSIPHHLRSKAAGVNSGNKDSQILAVGLFTTQERTSCTQQQQISQQMTKRGPSLILKE